MTAPDYHLGTPLPVTSVMVECHDGRRCDITGLAPADAIQRLRQHGIRPSDVRRTMHYLASGVVFAERLPFPAK